MPAMNLLVVDGNTESALAVAAFLEKWSFTVGVAFTIDQARQRVREGSCALLLLESSMPDGSGLDFLDEIRTARRSEYVVLMSDHGEPEHLIHGLEMGADDYLVKPFDMGVMLARIRAVTRRQASSATRLRHLNGFAIDLENRLIMHSDRRVSGERRVTMTAKEWFVLERLVKAPYAIVGKSQLQAALYESGHEADSNTIEVYISQIRRKLGAGFVETIRGLGYRLGKVDQD
jgi:two-component system OmpR family response regulator